MRPMILPRLMAAIAAAVALAPTGGTAQQQGEVAVICTNPVSGWHWQIKIDYRKNTVDSYPANIDGTEISWLDPKDGGYNTIDRSSGELTTALGSSTGGWLRHNRCNVEQLR
jgi:hypothetical protein